MRELKILGVVIFFTLVVYIGVEPFAHSQMHPHVAPANFNFQEESIDYATEEVKKAEEKLDEAKSNNKNVEIAENQLKADKKLLDSTTTFWNEIAKIDLSKGDATKGAETFMNAGCVGCHGIKSQGMPSPMDDATASASFGVVPPDLSTAGKLYDGTFLAALIKDPVKALKVEHKFSETKPHPMPQFFGLGGDMNQELADIVAYLKSIAPKTLKDEEVFENACQRCHDIKYAKRFSNTEKGALANYMGSTPPDLSMMIRSKGKDYLQTFINNPQKQLHGTAMPRVGLTKESQEQVINFLEDTGDRKKEERESLGMKVVGFMIIFTILAYLWKVKIWREVH
ncbi:c-type cytochrome [Sulfurospirillum arcachonense]|uniref:c-type cytochrome n=1 Tax=Sulfurospirillum arcachonense TaxID=57666 RepID=UPI00046A9D2B|nr:c-type cytochrome [Sulfurospirillum arcachonense]